MSCNTLNVENCAITMSGKIHLQEGSNLLSSGKANFFPLPATLKSKCRPANGKMLIKAI